MLAPVSVILQISMLTMTDTCVLQRLQKKTNVGCHENRGSKEQDITPVSCDLELAMASSMCVYILDRIMIVMKLKLLM